ncbi:MAG TPA: conjugal transfer protein [Cytophagales bacterium]|nr:conjugal transfer protein [Cytophagales bacterium]
MIRMFQSVTSAQAKNYFKASLGKADYYLEGQEINGRFHGAVARRLGIAETLVTPEIFNDLCDNHVPGSQDSLTPSTLANRRVGYDISFHAPKSVSILHALGSDDRVLDVFKQSVQATMIEMEQAMQTRVRAKGNNHDRQTSEMLWTDFVHQTARPVAGHAPDPHLHCHCFTFNVTYDALEERYKAGQFHDIKRDMPWYQARFHKRLADGLQGLGYGVRQTRNAFEVVAIPQKAIDWFSKRTDLIGRIAEEQGITDPKQLDQLGAFTRGAKDQDLTMPELQEVWQAGLALEGIDVAEDHTTPTHGPEDAKEAIDHAITHEFTRASVKRQRQLLTTATHLAVDTPEISLDDLDHALNAREDLTTITEGTDQLCTTLEVQAEERAMIAGAQRLRGCARPITMDSVAHYCEGLNDQQAAAVKHVLTMPDRLVMIRGGAGTGKTTLIKNAVRGIEDNGKQVFLYAPTAGAARLVLRQEGFAQADTVAKLLSDQTLQDQLKYQVLWVDEAGMLGTQDMKALVDLAHDQNCRLILSGDPKQHAAVVRGDAMRVLNSVGRIPYQNVNVIYRQRSAQYKAAVKDISDGKVGEGFKQLDQMGAIVECDPSDSVQRLTQDYHAAIKDGKTALVVSPTNQQAQDVTKAIRQSLKETKHLGQREKAMTQLRPLHWTDPEKADPRRYAPGLVIQTTQNLPTMQRGTQATVTAIQDHQVKLDNGKALPLDQTSRFEVFQPGTIEVAQGDLIRITRNGSDASGRRLTNGKLLEVTKLNPDGSIQCQAQNAKAEALPFTLNPDHGHVNLGYCLTSYASQGKTVDRVLIAQPAATFPASDQKQFYVSVSRGRDSVTIYTDDKEDLLRTISQDGDRRAATELVPLDSPERTLERSRGLRERQDIEIPDRDRDRDYEGPRVE